MTQRLDIVTLIQSYSSEETCRELLEELRWPNGVACLKCGATGERVTRVSTRDTWRCLECAYHFSVRAGTVLQDSKLPLSKWMLATYMVCEAKKGISSNQLKRMLGVTYKTAWFLTHRIRGAMGQVERPRLNAAIIEADETWHGGKYRYQNGTGTNPETGKGRGGRRPNDGKVSVLGAVERGGEVRFKVSARRDIPSIRTFIEANVEDGTPRIMTDEWSPYAYVVPDEDTKHETVNHRSKEWVRGDVHTNSIESVWSLFKRSVVGTHHHMSVKHLPAYLDEIAFKYNNRDNEHIFRETLRVLVTADPLTYAELIED